MSGQYPANTPINFSPGVTFGSAIGTVTTPPINSFILQHGIYQIHLSGLDFNAPGFTEPGTPSVGGIHVPVFWQTTNSSGGPFGGTFLEFNGGDRLISVGDNTNLNFVFTVADITSNIDPWCWLVITKLQ
jgi:hypothetical protein